MNAYPSPLPDLTYSDLPPVLLVASSDAAMRLAEKTLDASGLRIAAKVDVEEGEQRITEQAAASAVWLELDRDDGQVTANLLTLVDRDVAGNRYAAVVSTSKTLFDRVDGQILLGEAEILIDASEPERVAALPLALARKNLRETVAEMPGDRSAERLRQLSDEVSRIATALSRLTSEPNAILEKREVTVTGDVPAPSADRVSKIIRARRLRSRYFDETLFADPAWDMMLDLLQAEIRQHRVPVSSLCIAAAVPATTALRWLKTLVSQGLFLRRADPHDGRRVFVELAPETSALLRRYFAETEGLAGV